MLLAANMRETRVSMPKRVASWYILTSGLQVKHLISKPQLLTLNLSKEHGHAREEEEMRSLMEQARHHLCYVGGLEGEREHDGICYESTDCKERVAPLFCRRVTTFMFRKIWEAEKPSGFCLAT